MRVILFADGSPRIGAGHQVRMACLAEELLARGHEALLVAHALPEAPHAWAWRGLPQQLLPPADRGDAALHALVAARRPAWLVVDCYRIDDAWLAELAQGVRSLLLDDVPGSRSLARADLILNQNLGVESDEYPPGSLVGPDHALVRRPFREVERAPRGGEYLVLAGGTDVGGITAVAIGSILDQDASASVHCCGGVPPVDARVRRHVGLDAQELAGHMARCRAGVLAAGSAVYEALSVGLPFVAVQVADNQARILAGLRERGWAPVIDLRSTGTLAADVGSALAGLPVDGGCRLAGDGAARIVTRMEAVP